MASDLIDILISVLWAALPALITGVALAEWNHKQKERDDITDHRERMRQRGEMVQLDLIVATAELARATAVAVKCGKTNGEMDKALGEYNEAISRFREYERERVIEN